MIILNTVNTAIFIKSTHPKALPMVCDVYSLTGRYLAVETGVTVLSVRQCSVTPLYFSTLIRVYSKIGMVNTLIILLYTKSLYSIYIIYILYRLYSI